MSSGKPWFDRPTRLPAFGRRRGRSSTRLPGRNAATHSRLSLAMSMGGLATHLANIPLWGGTILNEASFDLAGAGPNQEEKTSRAQILAAFDDARRGEVPVVPVAHGSCRRLNEVCGRLEARRDGVADV